MKKQFKLTKSQIALLDEKNEEIHHYTQDSMVEQDWIKFNQGELNQTPKYCG